MKKTKNEIQYLDSQIKYLFFPIKHVPILPSETIPETSWYVQINQRTHIKVYNVPWMINNTQLELIMETALTQ